MDLKHKGKKRVAYFYNTEISKYTYARDHPMKPERIAMTHSLINTYHIYRHLDVYMAREATKTQMTKFHTEDYISYLQKYVSRESQERLIGVTRLDEMFKEDSLDEVQSTKKKQIYKVGESYDCPAFLGLYNFCMLSAGASIDCATAIISNKADIAINWGGGLHHAKKCESSGFCYVNDIVLSILELLYVYQRVLYIDIDVHHGDGVEEAFYLTNRVMTLSFHLFEDNFFPGTGDIDDCGYQEGKYYSLNVPMKKGMDDDSYEYLFKSVTDKVISHYRPDVIVFQLGADSLAEDRLGKFNLSIKGHGSCLRHILNKGIKVIMLGGGGYTINNVSKCWAYETGLTVGIEIDQDIPGDDLYFNRYQNKKFHHPIKKMQNQNPKPQLDRIINKIAQHLRNIPSRPGIGLHYLPMKQQRKNGNSKGFGSDQEDVQGQKE